MYIHYVFNKSMFMYVVYIYIGTWTFEAFMHKGTSQSNAVLQNIEDINNIKLSNVDGHFSREYVL